MTETTLTQEHYDSYCWFVYTIEMPNGDMNTARELFPPLGRNDIYGGITQTQARTLAFARLNELERKYKDVRVEMID